MTDTNDLPDMRDLLTSLGYQESSIRDILDELGTLLKEIEFHRIKQKTDEAFQENDRTGWTASLKDLMNRLEPLGYYRPDIPNRLLKLIVNGLNLKGEDIFSVLDNAGITEEEKRKEKEFLTSCAAITQLGYILLSCLVPNPKAASAGPHVFIIIKFPHSAIFADFSLGSILEIDVGHTYIRKGHYHYLKDTGSLDRETSQFITGYYSVFHVTSGCGLSHNIHNNLGIAYDKAGRYPEAIEELKEALKLDPGYIEVRNNLAVVYYHMGRCEEAVQELQQVIRSNPDSIEARCNLGNIYAGLLRYDEAVKELQEALRLDPGCAAAHNNLGNIYVEQKKDPEALREFQDAVRLDPDYALAHTNLGNIYKESGRFEDAIREFEEGLRVDPEFIEANYGIGLAYYHMGSYERAVHPLVRAACLRPPLLELVPEKLKLKVTRGISRLNGIL